MLYVATGDELQPSPSPSLKVGPVRPAVETVKRWFTLPHVSLVGSHMSCGCGFPSIVAEEPVEYFEGMFNEDPERRAKDLASVNALLMLIREALTSGGEVQVFAVWAGDEWEEPAGSIELFIEDLVAERFFFIEHFFYRVRSRA
jgi:hypothetical protein